MLGRYLTTALGLNFKIYENIIEGGDRTFESCTSPMANRGTYELNILNTDKIILK